MLTDEQRERANLESLLVDLLSWFRKGPRPYAEVLEAWRTSCPRLPVWEEANARGYLRRAVDPALGRVVSLSALGRAHLDGR